MFRFSLAAVSVALAICAAPTARADVFQSQSAPGMCLNVAVGGASIQPCDGSRLQDIVVIDEPDNPGAILFVTPACLVMPTRENEMLAIFNCMGASDSPPPGAFFQLGSDGSVSSGGFCIDIKGKGRKAGTKVIAFRCNGQANQRWTQVATGTGISDAVDGTSAAQQKARLSINSAPSLCMGVSPGGMAELQPCSQAPVLSVRADGALSAIFSNDTMSFLSPDGRQGDQLRFMAATSVEDLNNAAHWGLTANGLLRSDAGLCADAKDNGNRPGTPIILFKCSGNPNQHFTLIED
jgi:hypothetical protein